MTGLSSKTVLNLIIIIFVSLTIYTLKNDVIGFFKSYDNKEKIIQATSPTIVKDTSGNIVAPCEAPNEEMRLTIAEKQGTLEALHDKLEELRIDLEKPYAPYSFTYKEDLEYYNSKVSEYNTDNIEVENMILIYNTQLEVWQSCSNTK